MRAVDESPQDDDVEAILAALERLKASGYEVEVTVRLGPSRSEVSS